VGGGSVGLNCSSIGIVGDGGRVWVVSSLKQCLARESGARVVTFERGSELEGIADSAFYSNGLKSIVIPASVVCLGSWSFSQSRSLEYVLFENGSRLERIGQGAFGACPLESIVIPSRVTFVDGSAFDWPHLEMISICPNNATLRLSDGFLEDFGGSTIYRYVGKSRSVVIPSSVVVLGTRSFPSALNSVIFENGSRLQRIPKEAFFLLGWSRL
jgi:hypothetical protein